MAEGAADSDDALANDILLQRRDHVDRSARFPTAFWHSPVLGSELSELVSEPIEN